MAGEVTLVAPSMPATAYFVVRNSSGQYWYTVTPAFEAYNAAHWTDYDVALAQDGSSQNYTGTFPSAITTGVYQLSAYAQSGGSPAVGDVLIGTDARFEWSGTAVVSLDSRVKPADTLARVTLTDTVTTYTGNTPQTGDAYAYLTTNLGLLGANLSAIPKAGFKLASDGLDAVIAWAVAITGNITGNLSGSVGSVATGGITAASIADGAIDAATFAADVDAEILSYLVDDATRIDASSLNTATVTTIPAILVDTAEIGAAGAGLTEAGGTGDQLTAVPWNAAWDAEVQSECADALTAYGASTVTTAQVNAECDTAIADAALATAANLATVLADTNELQTDWANGGRLDLILDATATASAIATAQSDLDILTGTDGVTLATSQPNYAPSTAASLAALAGKFTGITLLAQWLGAAFGKQTPDATALTEINATGAGSGTFTGATDSLEALRDRGDSAWITATGFSTFNPTTDVVAHVTLVDTTTTNTDMRGTDNAALASVLGTPAGASVSADIAAVNAKTTNLPSDPADASVIAGRFDTLDTSVADLPTNAELAAALGTADDAVLAAIAALNDLSSADVTAAVPTVVQIQSGLATPTNITAGTITTVTNLTNAPTAGDFTAAMKTSLNQATPAVTVSDKTGFSLASTGLDSISATAAAGVPTTFASKLMWLVQRFLGKATKTDTEIKVYADDGTTVLTTQTATDDGVTETQGAAT